MKGKGGNCAPFVSRRSQIVTNIETSEGHCDLQLCNFHSSNQSDIDTRVKPSTGSTFPSTISPRYDLRQDSIAPSLFQRRNERSTYSAINASLPPTVNYSLSVGWCDSPYNTLIEALRNNHTLLSFPKFDDNP